ncbi:MAG: type IX secretion system protein PorQ [Bacteroidales bacterium]|nr:type IX secretion system protein PorQ [Bacteroidales bacterium]MBN2757364.1 type IX secretion system protein PorQ [Bacteroidales bacterium]
MNFKKVIIYIFIISFYFPIYGQIGGNSTYDFLNLTNSARVAALGGDNISIQDSDLNFVYHNPALLNNSMSNNIVINYVNYFADINYGYAAYAKNLSKLGIFAAGIHYINYGKFIEADYTGNIIGEFKAYELALNIFCSKPLLDSILTAGINLKPIYSKLEKYSSFGLALDFGLSYNSNSKLFSAGLVIKNIGHQIKPYTQGNYEPLPFDIQLGLTQKLSHAPFRFSVLLHHLYIWDLTYNINANQAFSTASNTTLEQTGTNFFDKVFRHSIFSLEFIPTKNFILMVGYNHQKRKEMLVLTKPFLVGYSWGLQIKISKFKISYSQSILHLAGISNHISLNLNLNNFYRRF